jgi:hypothetical protein
MRRHLAPLLAAVLLVAACGEDEEAPAPAEAPTATETPAPAAKADEKVSFDLKEENGSGRSGSATLRGGDGGFTVSVVVKRHSGPAHIHNVTCEEYRALKAFDEQLATVDLPLPDLENGKSRSQETASLSEYRTGGYSLNVHSVEGGFPVVACGDVPRG